MADWPAISCCATARREIELRSLTVTLGRAPWRLAPPAPPLVVRWTTTASR